MSNWFTVKVKYTKQLEDGSFKSVSEPYLLNAMSFTDAETRIYEELGNLIRGEFLVTGISRADFHDIFKYDDTETWYKVKISFESGGEDGGKAKKVSQNFLISANSVKEAYDRMNESLNGMMIDYGIPSIALSPIVEIFPFNDENQDQVGKEFTKLVKSEVAEHKLGTKTVFSSSGSDSDDSDNEDSFIEDQFGEEE